MKKVIDKQLLKYLLAFYLGFFLLMIISGILGKIEGAAYTSLSWKEFFSINSVRYFLKLTFILTAILTVRYIEVKVDVKKWIVYLLHLIFGVGLTFYSVASQVVVNNWLYGTDDELTWNYVYGSALLGTDYNFFLYFSMAAIVFMYYFFQRQRDYRLKESQLKTQLLDSQIQALQSQLQPHFLFNTLNDITSLIDIKPEKAQDAISDLSELLRETLNLKDVKLVTIAKELALLKKYTDIEKLRFSEKVNFKIQIEDTLLDYKIPPLILQPIVENSIKHGFSLSHDSLQIDIIITDSKDFLNFNVSNNGQPLRASKITYGTGLDNVISRLETIYGSKFTFEIKNKSENTGVQAAITIPKTVIL